MAGEKRGSLGFFSTYRPPVPLDIYSSLLQLLVKPVPDVFPMTEHDGESHNYNGRVIPSESLKTLLKRPELASKGSDADVDSGQLSGIIFVSERGQLETLYIALRSRDKPKPEVFSLADVFGTSDFNGTRLEDSGCFAGDYLIYVSTKEPAPERRQPWTALYKTHLKTGKTYRLTPEGTADLSPSVSPSGKQILVASFDRNGRKSGWDGAIEDLQTDLVVVNIEPYERKFLVENGGWPTWGSEDVIYFHRRDSPKGDTKKEFWGVYRYDISTNTETRVTPDAIDAMTPAAIDDNRVAVATVREKSELGEVNIRREAQYRHIEVFYSTGGGSIKITQATRPKADHFNPFVIDAGKYMFHIGYHRCMNELRMEKKFQKIASPNPDIGLFRVTGVFPTFNTDGSMLAFVDNEFKSVWVVNKDGCHLAYEEEGPDKVFSPVFNQNPQKDTLYVCVGPSFNQKAKLVIHAIPHVSRFKRHIKPLTKAFDGAPVKDGSGNDIYFNSAFPSSSPDGKRFVFRSVRKDGRKNLYIMEDAATGELEGSKITRLTEGDWVDTHCQWSPSGDWIVFSSTRDKPTDADPLDNGLDAGYFAVFLVNVKNPDVKKVVRVMGSGSYLAGHVNHPFFSPDGKSLVVTADLAAVSVDPISLPLFLHSVRPYGDIFIVDIDPEDINKNKDLSNFTRITHSKYENSTATWTKFSTDDPNAAWNLFIKKDEASSTSASDMVIDRAKLFTPACPYTHGNEEEGWHMTGHLILPKRCC